MNIRPRAVRHPFLAGSLCLALTAFLTSAASAQDLFTGVKDSASMGVAGSDLASPLDALGAVSSNVAGLASSEGSSLHVSGIAVFGHGRYTSPTSTGGHMDAFLGAAPSIAFVTPLRLVKDWRISLSATPDTSLAANWYYNDAPGTAGVTYGYQQNRSYLLNERFAVGAGGPLGKRFKVGASFGVVYDSSSLIAPTIFQQQPVLKGLKTLLTLNTRGVGFNGTAGIIFAPTRKLQLGLNYKTSTSIHGTGTADGNLSALLAALGLTGSFRPDFHYNAALDNTLPQIFGAGLTWDASPRTRVFLRGDLVNWSTSFNRLGLKVTNGNNADLNGLVGANNFSDIVPLNWHNQGILHAGVQTAVHKNLLLRAGYMFGNNPVPSTTLTPLTAAITRQSLAAGVGYHSGRYSFDAGYQAGLPNTASVGANQSVIKAGEYNNSSTELSTQTLYTAVSIKF